MNSTVIDSTGVSAFSEVSSVTVVSAVVAIAAVMPFSIRLEIREKRCISFLSSGSGSKI